ncbi:class I SAM-dependent methyltransferase [Candidatus Hecatella orcuttiae]|uniref:class I SAM-dependent methyltransferase n=1 Tax=Candidatus Hecatella orcuttiae TaxID=1935119 RepID=UPI00286810A2|nr:methyltransferase domain-containing protein [Candidatus Hecatella orcuttiae]
MPHIFDASRKDLLEDPERWKGTSISTMLRKAGLRRGKNMVDMGCGTGFFSLPASEIVGFRGLVCSIDLQLKMLGFLKSKLKTSAGVNVEPVLSSILDAPLHTASVDLVLLVDTLHEVERKNALLKEAWRILKPKGRIAVVDWKKARMDIGPPWEERLSLDEVLHLLAQAGFGKPSAFQAGHYHYGVTAVKPDSSSPQG